MISWDMAIELFQDTRTDAEILQACERHFGTLRLVGNGDDLESDRQEVIMTEEDVSGGVRAILDGVARRKWILN